MPNARAIERRLMKHRQLSFWGSRAFMTVSFPLAWIPEPMPKFEDPGKPHECFGGSWKKVLEDGRELALFVSKISYSGNRMPVHGEVIDDDERKIKCYFPERDEYGHIHWWEGYATVNEPGSKEWKRAPEYDLDEDVIAAYRELRKWKDKYLVYMEWVREHPLRSPMWEMEGWSKTHYDDVIDGRVYMQFSVKWFYRYYRRRFCNAVRKAIKIARKHNLDFRVHKSPWVGK